MARGSHIKALALLPAFALAGLTMACGAGGNGSGGTTSQPTGGAPAAQEIPTEAKDARLAALVPPAISADGKIVVGQDQTYPPNEFVDQGKAVGFDVDLGNAIGQKLGLTVQYQNVAFSGILAGLASGQYELAMSSLTVNPERLQTVDMVSYYSAGSSLAVLKGNPDHITLDDLCGKNVAVQQGTVQVDDLTQRSQDCVSSGKPAINLQQFQAQTDVNLQVTTKRSQAMLADSPVVDYAVKQTDGAIEVVGQPYDTAPYGIALKKGQGTYSQAIQGAVQALIDDGTYAKILAKWGLSTAGAITKAEVNPAG